MAIELSAELRDKKELLSAFISGPARSLRELIAKEMGCDVRTLDRWAHSFKLDWPNANKELFLFRALQKMLKTDVGRAVRHQTKILEALSNTEYINGEETVHRDTDAPVIAERTTPSTVGKEFSSRPYNKSSSSSIPLPVVVNRPVKKTRFTAPVLIENEDGTKGDLVMLFALGRVTATPCVIELMGEKGMQKKCMHCLMRHSRGDFGDMCDEDKKANRRAITDGARVFSSYDLERTFGKLWIITEADRSATTMLQPHEY